jgi:uncharacterized protein YxjI
MEINIKQKAISFGDRYKVFIGDRQAYAASLKVWRWRPELEIKDDREKVIMTIKKKVTFFTVVYQLFRGEHQVFTFERTSFWKRRYRCVVSKDVYDINRLGWRSYEIYKNNVQVGAWKQAITFLAGDTYTITADDSSDPLLLIAFCLIIDNIKARAAAAAAS